jgi:hypothetical protein
MYLLTGAGVLARQARAVVAYELTIVAVEGRLTLAHRQAKLLAAQAIARAILLEAHIQRLLAIGPIKVRTALAHVEVEAIDAYAAVLTRLAIACPDQPVAALARVAGRARTREVVHRRDTGERAISTRTRRACVDELGTRGARVPATAEALVGERARLEALAVDARTGAAYAAVGLAEGARVAARALARVVAVRPGACAAILTRIVCAAVIEWRATSGPSVVWRARANICVV